MGSDAKKTELAPGNAGDAHPQDHWAQRGADARLGIARHIEQMSDDVLQVEEGSLYRAPQRLAFKGRVKAERGQPENNRRARLNKLTPAGRKRLKQEVADLERVPEAILRVVQPT
jgi:PadR family transcriptional regulator, regulatory protein PadR